MPSALPPSRHFSSAGAYDPKRDEERMVEAVREVLIEAHDIVPVGDEPFVGWSLVLAERIVAALPRCGKCERPKDGDGVCWFHTTDRRAT